MPQSLQPPTVRRPDEQQGGTKHGWPAIRAVLVRAGRADSAARPGRQDGQRSRPLLTARGAVAAMLLLFLAGNLSGAWLHAGLLASLSFAAGCVLAVCYTRHANLLLVVATPPVIFAVAVTCTQLLTAPGDSFSTWAESVAAGVLLALGAAAPWLLGGMAAALVIAVFRGLPACLASLRAGLRAPARPDSAR